MLELSNARLPTSSPTYFPSAALSNVLSNVLSNPSTAASRAARMTSIHAALVVSRVSFARSSFNHNAPPDVNELPDLNNTATSAALAALGGPDECLICCTPPLGARAHDSSDDKHDDLGARAASTAATACSTSQRGKTRSGRDDEFRR